MPRGKNTDDITKSMQPMVDSYFKVYKKAMKLTNDPITSAVIAGKCLEAILTSASKSNNTEEQPAVDITNLFN